MLLFERWLEVISKPGGQGGETVAEGGVGECVCVCVCVRCAGLDRAMLLFERWMEVPSKPGELYERQGKGGGSSHQCRTNSSNSSISWP
jgi:hypothetical protein